MRRQARNRYQMGPYVTIRELATRMGWSLHKARAVVNRGKIPSFLSRVDGRRKTDPELAAQMEDEQFEEALRTYLAKLEEKRWAASCGSGEPPRKRGRPRKGMR